MKSRQPGFTIIELMITLVVLSILLAAAVPSFREFTLNNRVIAAQNDLVTAMSLARSEAIKRSRDVRVCASTDGAACSDETNWTTGWIVTAAGAARPIQTWPAVEGTIAVGGDVTELRYQPTGTVAVGGVFTVTPPHCTGRREHQITVLISGSPQSVTQNCP